MWEGGGRNLIKHSQLTVAFDTKPKNIIIIYICKAAFLTVHSALQLLRTFTFLLKNYKIHKCQRRFESSKYILPNKNVCTDKTTAHTKYPSVSAILLFAQTKISKCLQPYRCLHRQQYSTHQISKCLQPFHCLHKP